MQQFLLENDSAYRDWRELKLCDYPKSVEHLIVDINDPYKLTIDEKNSLLHICQKTNLVIYKIAQTNVEDKNIVAIIAKQLGLVRMDANLCADQDKISSIQVVNGGLNSTYIPYTNKSLNWHTDGYYNKDEHRIRAFLMHCVRPAISGGENTYLDPEIIYILLRDDDPKYIEVLMDKDAMTIPPNLGDSEQIRSEKSGPVFLMDKLTQSLYMRFTARSHNVIWKNNATTKQVRSKLLEVIKDNEFQFSYLLQAGEGVICNNVIHNRTSFVDDPSLTRLLYRARFYDRVSKPEHTHDYEDETNQCCG